MNLIAYSAIAVVVCVSGGLWWLGRASATGAPPGLQDHRLTSCNSKSNCVCSEHIADGRQFVEPIALSPARRDRRLEDLTNAVRRTGGEVVSGAGDYVAARYVSGLFRFVDDVEFRLSGDELHVRSASRVGKSDFGANRKRVEALRARIERLQ